MIIIIIIISIIIIFFDFKQLSLSANLKGRENIYNLKLS